LPPTSDLSLGTESKAFVTKSDAVYATPKHIAHSLRYAMDEAGGGNVRCSVLSMAMSTSGWIR